MDLGSILLLMTTGALEGLRDCLPSYRERFLLLSSRMGAQPRPIALLMGPPVQATNGAAS